eukprot:GHRR01007876.1.p3 GENE.GHRR01007876.1~~GHRR01007876.1.p3  ORF type:complete len:127 (+),score=27.31 GHRR01007876.1:2859-3239(+)
MLNLIDLYGSAYHLVVASAQCHQANANTGFMYLYCSSENLVQQSTAANRKKLCHKTRMVSGCCIAPALLPAQCNLWPASGTGLGGLFAWHGTHVLAFRWCMDMGHVLHVPHMPVAAAAQVLVSTML